MNALTKIDPIVHVEGNRVYATSKDVAAYFGKRHDDVLKAIKELLCATAKACARNFAATSVTVPMPNGGARTTKIYQMDRDGFLLLAMAKACALNFEVTWEMVPMPNGGGQGHYAQF